MKPAHELVADPCTALARAVLAEAVEDRKGRWWIRTNRWARFWSIEAGVEWADLVAEADRRDGYGRRSA